jgi:hypothetical protein
MHRNLLKMKKKRKKEEKKRKREYSSIETHTKTRNSLQRKNQIQRVGQHPSWMSIS